LAVKHIASTLCFPFAVQKSLLTFKCLYWLVIGVGVGVGVGAMPGLTASTGVALMIPLTFTMGTANALALLIGLYKGAV